MKGTRYFVKPPGWLVAVFDWSVKASTLAVHLSNWLRPLQLPQLTKGWFKIRFGLYLVQSCHTPVYIRNIHKYIFILLVVPFRKDLKFVRIYFDTPTFDRVTKDKAAKFVDKLSAIGGTMGLLTGFSLISAVEIIYFMFKIITSFIKSK